IDPATGGETGMAIDRSDTLDATTIAAFALAGAVGEDRKYGRAGVGCGYDFALVDEMRSATEFDPDDSVYLASSILTERAADVERVADALIRQRRLSAEDLIDLLQETDEDGNWVEPVSGAQMREIRVGRMRERAEARGERWTDDLEQAEVRYY